MKKLLEHTRRPDISFSRNGIIRITARLAHILSINPGDTINISLSNNECLLHAAHIQNPIGRHKACCYPTKKGSVNYCANSVHLCRALLDFAKVSAAKAAFMTGQPFTCDNTIYVPIITLKPLL